MTLLERYVIRVYAGRVTSAKLLILIRSFRLCLPLFFFFNKKTKGVLPWAVSWGACPSFA